MSVNRLLIPAVLAGLAGAAPAAVITSYDFNASTLAPTPFANGTATNVSFGTSVNAPSYTNDFWASKPVLTVSRSNDTAAQVYLQVTVNAASGYELNLDSFTFNGARGGAAGPRTYEVHSSVAGLLNDASTAPTATSLASGPFTVARGASGATDAMELITTDLSSSAYDHLTSLTMRIYFYTPTVSQNIDLDNLTFNGTVNAVPEPASAAVLGLAAAGLGARRRRRR